MTSIPSMIWVKLHTRKLDDIRFAKINLAQLGRWTQLLMLSGKLDAGGCFYQQGKQLEISEIAYLLRCDVNSLQGDLDALQKAGLIIVNGHGPELVDFEQEQGPGDAEQRRQWIARQKKHRSQNVTRDKPVTHAPRTRPEPEPESESEPEEEQEAEVGGDPSNQPTSGDSPEKASPQDGGLETAILDMSRSQKDAARTAYKILGSSGLGNPKLLELSVKLAIRISLKDMRTTILAALASAYADEQAKNKAAVAAYRLEKNSVPPDYSNPKMWTSIPDQVLLAAGIENLDAFIMRRYAQGLGAQS
jgi:hypothetical protein